jgi:hypothetical protein
MPRRRFRSRNRPGRCSFEVGVLPSDAEAGLACAARFGAGFAPRGGVGFGAALGLVRDK